jgi:hypothetical protein
MINRLPKEFRLPAGNGRKPALGDGAEDGFAHRAVASAARCIGNYPVAALSAAFLVGLIAGRVVKR